MTTHTGGHPLLFASLRFFLSALWWNSGGTDSIYTVNTHPFTVGGFTANTTYYASVRPLCGSSNDFIGDWSDTINFTTAVCPNVTGLGTRSATTSSIEVYWDADPMAQSWIIEYGYHGFDLGTGTRIATTLSTNVINGLISGMDYDFRVRAVCGSDWQSEGWASTTATTLSSGITCNAPSAVSAVVSGNTATVSWTPGEGNLSFELEYGTRGFAHGGGTIVTTTASPITLPNLDYETNYDLYVRGICAENTYSEWSRQASFTTGRVGIADDHTTGGHTPTCTIYPNPTSSTTTISVRGISGKVRIAVVDMNGREVTSETLDCAGDCAKTMNVDNLAQGAYFVRITGENANIVKKLIVR